MNNNIAPVPNFTREEAEQTLNDIMSRIHSDSWVEAKVIEPEFLCPISHIMDKVENIVLLDTGWLFRYDGGKIAEFPIEHTIVRLFGEG